MMLGAVILIEMRGRIAPLDDEWYASKYTAVNQANNNNNKLVLVR